MEEFEVSLRQLVVETCQQKIGSLDRQRGLTRIVRSIAKSGKLWKENTPDYEDALQQTWLYFCRNLCEATTGDRYDPSRSSVTTWLNAYLRRRLQDLYLQRKTTNHSTIRQVYSVDEVGKDTIEALKLRPMSHQFWKRHESGFKPILMVTSAVLTSKVIQR